MATKAGELYFDLTVNLTGFSKGLKKAGAGLDKFNKSVSNFISRWRYVTVAVGAAAGAVAGFTTMAIKAANRQELAEARLQALLNNVRKERDKTTESLIRQAGSLERLTKFSQEEIITGQAMILSFQRTKAETEAATPRIIDIAAAVESFTGKQVSLQQVGIAVGKALDGNIGALSRMGIVLSEETKNSKDFAAIMKDIDLNVKGAAKAAGSTFGGQLVRLKNGLNAVMKAIGKLITKSAVLRGIMNGISKVFQHVSDRIGKHGNTIVLALNEVALTAVGVFQKIVWAVRLAYAPMFQFVKLALHASKIMALWDSGTRAALNRMIAGLEQFKDATGEAIVMMGGWQDSLGMRSDIQTFNIQMESYAQKMVQLKEKGAEAESEMAQLTATIREQALAAMIMHMQLGEEIPEALAMLAGGAIDAIEYVKAVGSAMGDFLPPDTPEKAKKVFEQLEIDLIRFREGELAAQKKQIEMQAAGWIEEGANRVKVEEWVQHSIAALREEGTSKMRQQIDALKEFIDAAYEQRAAYERQRDLELELAEQRGEHEEIRRIKLEQYQDRLRAMGATQDQVKTASEDWLRNNKLQLTEVEEAAWQAAEAFASGIGRAIASGQKFSDILKDLVKQIIKLAAMQLFAPLGPGGGMLGGLLGGLLGFQTGGTVPGFKGRPVLAMVHGGEHVFTERDIDKLIATVGAASRAGGDTVHVNMIDAENAERFFRDKGVENIKRLKEEGRLD